MNLQDQIISIVSRHPGSSSSEIHDLLPAGKSYSTTKRILARLVEKNLLAKSGKKKGTRYNLSRSYDILHSIDTERYFEKEIDERTINEDFNFNLIEKELYNIELFLDHEVSNLSNFQSIYERNIAELTEEEYNREIERLAIDLSWKSSQIEGNTYTLLETERLLKEKLTASGKHRDEATMLLNHKEAIDFILGNPDYLKELSIRAIEDVHTILTKDLGISRNLRKRRVGITGTNYRPLDNEFKIREAFESICQLINSKSNVYEKALLALVLISYVQGFVDGNKRTARIVSNAILIAYNHCPISFRTVDAIDYKKAMLVFYEQNNITPFKRIFIDQFEFAVRTYF